MSDRIVRLNAEVRQAINDHLVASYPYEACGFLIGRLEADRTVVEDHLPVSNQRRHDGAAANRFKMAPEDLRDAERHAAGAGLEMVGIYHSHPDVAAQPSEYDREHAWPWYQYLIVSVAGRTVREERIWELMPDRSAFTEHRLQIEHA